MSAVVLEASGLGRLYGSRWAVAGVNLKLSAGRSLLLAGSNGAGKTTLLRLLSGLLQATDGKVTVAGVDAHAEPQAARRLISLVGHRTGAWTDLGARETVRIDARLLGNPLSTADADALLARVGLAGRGEEPVREFSAGMRKRLGFARLLLQRPTVALLDEPYGQLDADGCVMVDGLLHELLGRGSAVVLATHLTDRASTRLDTGLVLHAGQMAWVGAAAGVPEALEALEQR